MLEPQAEELLRKESEKSYKELSKRQEREKQLAIVQRKLELKKIFKEKRQLQPKLVKAASKDNAAVYQFKFERKR